MKKIFNHTKRPQQEYNPKDYDWEYDAVEADDENELSEEMAEAEEGGADGYYDENGRWVETGGYYDEDGQWIETIGYYNEDGQWVYEEGYYDENGQWMVFPTDYSTDGVDLTAESDGTYDTEAVYDTEETAAEEVLLSGAAVAMGMLYEEPAEAYEQSYEGEEPVEAYEQDYEGEEFPESDATGYEEEDYLAVEEEEEDQENAVAAPGFLAMLSAKLADINVMDMVIVLSSIFVVILGIIVGGVFISKGISADQVSDFAQVGHQLDDIDLVGDDGLLAIGQATMNRIQAEIEEQERLEQEQEQENQGYNENEYDKAVSVTFSLTSVLKDLKIKITNKSTKKLISSVPFSILVTGEDGKEYTWTDEDRDGIIYQDSLSPGTYEVKMVALDEEKYSKYAIPSKAQSVIVKKEILYTKVDVSNEIKKESEVDASQEDTKKNETEIESVLPDTVTWVESTVTGNTYIEVAKSTITNPANILISGSFMKTAMPSLLNATISLLSEVDPPASNGTITPGSEPTSSEPTSSEPTSSEPTSSEPTSSEPTSSEPTSSEPTSSEPTSSEPTGSEPTGSEPTSSEPTGSEPTGSEPTGSEPTTGSESTTPSDEQDASSSGTTDESSSSTTEEKELSPLTSLTLTPAQVTLYLTGEEGKAKVASVSAKASGADEGKAVEYKLGSFDASVVSASINSTTGEIGLVALKGGTTEIEVIADYVKEAKAAVTNPSPKETKVTAKLAVTVVAKDPVVKLDKTQATIYVTKSGDERQAITATIESGIVEKPVITSVKSDNYGYLSVEQDAANKNKIYLIGVAEGSAKVIVTYTEGEKTVEAACAVVIKKHPSEDKSTALKDKSNQVIYVYENNDYRAATYADYYTASKFFIKGEPKYTGWQTLNGKLYFYNSEGKAVTGEQVIQGAKYTFASDGSLVTGSGTMGIDVSKWNGTIDWNAVKNSGVSYVIIRCGYRGSSKGALIQDPKYEANIKGATAAGLKVGVYFFTQAINEVEAVEEASMVLESVKKYKISYPIFLDVESSGGRADSLDKDTRTKIIKTFCETIRNAGYTPGVYANKNWLTNKMNASELSSYKIWLAQYAATPTYTGKFDMWQYKDTGKVSGISGNVDLNISYLGY